MDSRDDLSGRVLEGRYRLDRRIGSGGMSEVYRGTHLGLDGPVAVKVLLPDSAADETARRRFTREARGTFRLHHPGCVRILDCGATSDGIFYLVQEYLDGRTLARELAIDGMPSIARTRHILSQVADALDHAHAQGLIHRDLKPDNVMLIYRGSDPDCAVVLDFGLAKLWDEDGGGLSRIMSMAALTREGMTFGTPEYMSPEQACGETLDPASDIFSLGVVAYELLTGERPFKGTGPVDVLAAVVRDEVEAPSKRAPERNIPADLDALVLACLAKKAADRPASAAEVARALREGTAPAPQAAASVRAPAETLALPAVTETAQPPPTIDAPSAAKTARRWPWVVLTMAAAGAGLLWWMIPEPARSSAAAPPPAADATSAIAELPVDPLPSAASLDAGPPPQAPTQAAAADAAPTIQRTSPKPIQRPTPLPASKTAEQKRAEALVREARAANTTLSRMAKADAARRLDPANLEAQLLYGQALIDTGDKERGCQHLSRARRLRKARRAMRVAGCSD